jgi:protoporphyrinogen IX oxidase
VGEDALGLLWLKVLHIVAVISWMAALLYLPRLFVYHADVAVGSPQSELFKVMEYRLYRFIMRPAMAVTWVTGPLLLYGMGYTRDGWALAKLALVVGLTGVTGLMGRWLKAFADDRNDKNSRFFRIANEVPTVLMILIVMLVVLKPF